MFSRTTRSLFRIAQCNRGMATEAKDGLRLTFGSTAQQFYNDVKVKQVDVPTYSGSFGLLANHVPMLAVIKPGVVTVYEESGDSKKYFVAAGTVTMNEDSSLLLLTSEAIAVEDLDVSLAQKNLAAASSLNTPEGKVQAEVNQAIVDSVR